MSYAITPDRIQNFITNQKLLFLIDEKKTPTEALNEREKLRNSNKVSSDGSSAIKEPHQHQHEDY